MNMIILLALASASQYGGLIGDPPPRKPVQAQEPAPTPALAPIQASPSQPIDRPSLKRMVTFPTVDLPPRYKSEVSKEDMDEIRKELRELRRLLEEREEMLRVILENKKIRTVKNDAPLFPNSNFGYAPPVQPKPQVTTYTITLPSNTVYTYPVYYVPTYYYTLTYR